MNILLIGAGGIACSLIDTLTKMLGEKDQLTIKDGDLFEKKNAARQVFCVVGQNKAKMLSQRVTDLGFGEVTYDGTYLRPEDDMDALGDYDLIISCVDNNDTRLLLKELVDCSMATLIIGGNETDSANAFVYRNENPVEMNPFKNYPNLNEPDGLIPGGTCQTVEHLEEFPQTILANHMAGVGILMALQEWKDVIEGKQSLLDWMPYEWTFSAHTLATKKYQPSNEDE